MTQVASKIVGRSAGGRSRALDVDHYVSLRIRQRRIMLGLTQQQMAELIGVTYQQAHKYETGINRSPPVGSTRSPRHWESTSATSSRTSTPTSAASPGRRT
jgi:DNA-binding XRE family transcriptional regulator